MFRWVKTIYVKGILSYIFTEFESLYTYYDHNCLIIIIKKGRNSLVGLGGEFVLCFRVELDTKKREWKGREGTGGSPTTTHHLQCSIPSLALFALVFLCLSLLHHLTLLFCFLSAIVPLYIFIYLLKYLYYGNQSM